MPPQKTRTLELDAIDLKWLQSTLEQLNDADTTVETATVTSCNETYRIARRNADPDNDDIGTLKVLLRVLA